jgi:hypothetical protein
MQSNKHPARIKSVKNGTETTLQQETKQHQKQQQKQTVCNRQKLKTADFYKKTP